RCLFSVLYDTACRATEVVPGEDGEGGIRICDITLVKSEEEKKKGIYAEVRVLGKGRKYRTVYIGKNSLALIRQMLKERKRQPIRKRDLLFGFFKDKDETKPYPNLYAAMYRLIVSECERILGRHIHPHCLRHTKATHMAEAGANLIDIMAYLGHDDEKTAKIYVEISPSMGRNAFEKYHREISED
ncbi:MAG TPA: tyrosine-type recombinase/integrase, partial [Candidatus Hodarchaeales archaeon]|nr:tyrosine-type recombinase/integrase [Candidatus Hodarchaeales archaeon]